MSRYAVIAASALLIAGGTLFMIAYTSLQDVGAEVQLLVPVLMLAGIFVIPALACRLAAWIHEAPQRGDQLRPKVSSSRMMSSSPR